MLTFRPALWLAAASIVLLVGCRDAREPKVLFVGIDGVGVEILKELPTPCLDSLAATGWIVYNTQRRAPTVSGPMWSSLLTGAWPNKHGVESNDFSSNRYAEYPDFLSRLEQIDSTYATLTITDWPPLSQHVDGGPLLSDAIDRKVSFDGEELGYPSADDLSVRTAVELLSTADVDAAFVYLGNPDVAAHGTSGQSPEYRTSIVTADKQLGQIVDAVNRRRTLNLEDWLIIVSTDHGHRDEGGHGGSSPAETTTFFVASGSSTQWLTPNSVSPVDVAVIAMAHLGIDADEAWDLDGRPVGLK